MKINHNFLKMAILGFTITQKKGRNSPCPKIFFPYFGQPQGFAPTLETDFYTSHRCCFRHWITSDKFVFLSK